MSWVTWAQKPDLAQPGAIVAASLASTGLWSRPGADLVGNDYVGSFEPTQLGIVVASVITEPIDGFSKRWILVLSGNRLGWLQVQRARELAI